MLTFSWRLRATRRLAQATLLTALRGSLRGAFCGALLVAMSGPASVAAASLEGQQFDETAVLAERTLRLNGLGLRGVAWVKAFVAGLYLPAPTRDAAQVLTMPGPKRLRLKIMLEAPSHELTKSLTSRIARHEPDNVKAQLGARLDTLASHIDSIGNLRVGDTIDLDFDPGAGTSVRLNDRLVGAVVSGEDLYRSVLKIFVGEHPADKRMKEGLLRGGV
jgi:hypothetical protein